MPHSQPAPARSLPDKPSVGQLRKQAKELLKRYRAGDAAAFAEVERYERDADPARFVLADAQRVLARAYGFPSWTRLKQHVDGVCVKAFCEAADAGDVATIRRLAKSRPELVNVGRGGDFGERTALHFAVLNRDEDMTRALMELGSDARKGFWPHRDATSAHTIAVDREYGEIVAIIEQAEARRRKEWSPPGATIDSKTDEILKAIAEDRCDDATCLLESDVSLVGACDDRGVTPLHCAARAHSPKMVAWLLDRQAAVDARASFDVQANTYHVPNISGKTPLDYAAIVAGWSANDRFFPFLENAQVEPARFHETARLLRSKGAELTPRAAVAMGDSQAVLKLHREGRLMNEVHFYRGGLISIAVRVNRFDMVRMLLDLGLDPDEPAIPVDDGSRSWGMPLWFATLCGRHEIAKLLLARGADVNAIVYACGDSLCIADSTQDEKMRALLLEHGARVTVEHVARYGNRETAKAILDGTTPAQSLDVQNPSHTELAEQMLWAAASCDAQIVRMCLPHIGRKRDDAWWNYILMHATLPDSLKLILEHGVDPDVVGGIGFTTLHHLATVEEPVVLAEILLDSGASLHQRDSVLKSTPLGWACRWGRIELAELYLKRGADAVEAESERWATPLAWAEKGDHKNIIELLRSHGAE